MGQDSTMYKKIKVEDAVGLVLAHDITEIRPGEFKGVSFKRGYKVEAKDIYHLQRLGKRHLYILNLDDNLIHEDDAVAEMAAALGGDGVTIDDSPKEGKLQLYAAHDGLVKIDVDALVAFNMVPDVMCASIHTNTPVKKGNRLAGTRVIPLAVSRESLDSALDVARNHAPIFRVAPYKKLKCRLVVTGSEVASGLIEDRFEPIVRKKIESYGSELLETVILTDDRELIAGKIKSFLGADTDLIITTGGMSVDPDDVTRLGIRDAGVDTVHYGAAVLPGAMFQLAYAGEIPIMGIPACALFHDATVFDLILPRILAGERPDNRDLAKLAHGGLCLDCEVCTYPSCSFGKA